MKVKSMLIEAVERSASAAKVLLGGRVKSSEWEKMNRLFDWNEGGERVKDAFRESAWVFACVTVLSQKFSGTPFVSASRVTGRGVRRPLERERRHVRLRRWRRTLASEPPPQPHS